MNKLTQAHAMGPTHIPLLQETIGARLLATANQFPDNDALISIKQNYRASYKEFVLQSTELEKALLAHGLQQGDRVGIWSPNCYEWTLL